MNIDKIKWMVGYAENFTCGTTSVNYKNLYTPNCQYRDIENWVMYPHLLTRTIEGINRHWLEGGIYHIVQGKSYVSVYTLGSSDIQKYSMNEPDEAKQAAIDYVYKQEHRNERFN